MKTVDLTPQFKGIKSAEQELQLPFVQESMAMQMGGLAMYSKAFKRGSGDRVFGSDDNGIWLGKADFDGAPFRVDMDGNVVAESIASATTDTDSNDGGAGGQEFTSEADVTNSVISFTLDRATLVVIIGTGNRYVAQTGVGDYNLYGHVRLKIDGVSWDTSTWQASKSGTDSNGGTIAPFIVHFMGVINAGSHTMKLTGQCENITSTGKMVLWGSRISYATSGGVL